jgi:hypothetical protein
MRVILKVGRKIRGNTSNLIPGFEPDDNSIAIPKPLEGQSGCLILNNNAEGIGPGEPGGASSGASLLDVGYDSCAAVGKANRVSQVFVARRQNFDLN